MKGREASQTTISWHNLIANPVNHHVVWKEIFFVINKKLDFTHTKLFIIRTCLWIRKGLQNKKEEWENVLRHTYLAEKILFKNCWHIEKPYSDRCVLLIRGSHYYITCLLTIHVSFELQLDYCLKNWICCLSFLNAVQGSSCIYFYRDNSLKFFTIEHNLQPQRELFL